jgi:hypothetical protein
MLRPIFKLVFVPILITIFWPVVLNAQVVISEIMYDPTGKDEGHEWIEIYNKGIEAVTIVTGGDNNAWRFSDGSQHSLVLARGNSTLAGGSYAVIVDSLLRFLSDQPGYSGTIFDSSISLNNLIDDLTILSSKDGQVLNQVFYSSSQGGSGDGSSLQLQEEGNWIASTPTPGFQNSNRAVVLNNSNKNSELSAHYSSVPQGERRLATTLGVGIGRDRIGAVGSPMEFKVETSLDPTKYNTFLWNFGDGSQAGGSVLTHTYDYPGDYSVVLNASFFGKGDAVSRINVKIVDPQLSITNANQERIEIKNNSPYEISLFGRALVTGDKFFTFPKDTILGPSQTLSYGSNITQLYPLTASDVFIAVLGNAEQPKFRDKIQEQKNKQINYIKEQIKALQLKMFELFSKQTNNK